MSLDFDLYIYDESSKEEVRVFESNITHNLNTMAAAAGIYTALWRPEENGFTNAAMLVPVLCAGLKRLEGNPETYMIYNDNGGWGSYENLIDFTRRVKEACQQYPDARIEVSR